MHGADSGAQRHAENEVRDALNAAHGWSLTPQSLDLAPGSRVDIDGVDHVHKVVVEIIARYGPRSASRDKKIVSDATKLHLARKRLGAGYRAFVVGCDDDFLKSYRPATSTKWQAFALRELEVEVLMVALPPSVQVQVKEAQSRQARSNRLS